MSKIIVGVDGSDGSRDAIALASGLAGMTGSTLLLANVFPYDEKPSRAANTAFEAYLREDAEALLEREHKTVLGDGAIETRAVPNTSAPHGLHVLAEREEAALLVVGSTHTGHAGRVLPGSTAERLLHGAPCPVAVTPKGYAERYGKDPIVIGCGHDGSLSSQHALAAARLLAEATGAQLRVIRAFEPMGYDVTLANAAMGGAPAYNSALKQRAAEELNTAVERLPGNAEPVFAVGNPARILVEASEYLDMLLVGSRGYGPLHAVALGGVSGRLVREAACPVIVFPRGAAHTGYDSVFAEAASLPS